MSAPLEQGVDEWRNRCALRQHDQSAEHDHDNEHRQKPVFLAYPQERPGGCCSARERHPVEPTRPRGLRQPSIVSSWRPERGLPFARRLPELYRPLTAALRTGSTLGLAPATVVSYRCLWRVRDRFCANYPLNYANNERSSSQPHSPVGRAVHAGRCGSHDRLWPSQAR